MCGIFGFVSSESMPAVDVIEGLRRLEYRGYDSWGVAAVAPGAAMRIVRRVGKISRASGEELRELDAPATVVIGHTRWATHGPATVSNAHPHLSQSGRIAVVHNGIIENYRTLRAMLEADGFRFRSETDTETIAHLIDWQIHRSADFHEALSRTLLALRGAFGLAVIDIGQPDRLFVARLGSPLVIGPTAERIWISSDAQAMPGNARQAIFLRDGEWADVSAAGVATFDFHRALTPAELREVQNADAIWELGGYAHFMHKEIHEQPQAIADALRGRLCLAAATTHFGGLDGVGDNGFPARIKIVACGSSWHAGLVGRQWTEDLARIPTDVEYASEFRYRNPVIEPNTLLIAVSQSGETADTLAALRESRRRGAQAIGLVNVVGSSIARECGRGIYLHAGAEFGVAATKSFVNQLVVLLMLAIFLGRKRGLAVRDGLALLEALETLPDLVQKTLECEPLVRGVAEQYLGANNFLYVGRSLEFPIALEGALKLKEVSYIHAEGLPAAELKHGPIALVTDDLPTVVLGVQDRLGDKVTGNVQEIRARGGRIIAIIGPNGDQLRELADVAIPVPGAHPQLAPILAVIPTQLLAYHLAVLRACDVDQPRNLAKSVTVE